MLIFTAPPAVGLGPTTFGSAASDAIQSAKSGLVKQYQNSGNSVLNPNSNAVPPAVAVNSSPSALTPTTAVTPVLAPSTSGLPTWWPTAAVGVVLAAAAFFVLRPKHSPVPAPAPPRGQV